MKKKINNLKLLLSFYENDINVPINDLNKIYNDYRENYNLKIKEETKLFKKDSKIEIEKQNKKEGFLKLYKIIRNKKLVNYSGRKKSYLYSFVILIILFLSFYITAIIIWFLFFKKDDVATKWVVLCEQLVATTYKLMTSFYLMLFNNHTLEDINTKTSLGPNDLISSAFNSLINLYDARKYLKVMNDIIKFNDDNIIYDCYDFYDNLENEFFYLLKNEYLNKEFQFLFTMNYFCDWSNVMKFSNYRSIYMQLFNQVKMAMESYYNFNL